MGEKVVPIELEDEIDEAEIVRIDYAKSKKTILNFNSVLYGSIAIILSVAIVLIALRIGEFRSEIHRMTTDGEEEFFEDLSIFFMKMAIVIWVMVLIYLLLIGPGLFLLMMRGMFSKKRKRAPRKGVGLAIAVFPILNLLLMAGGGIGLAVNIKADEPLMLMVYFFTSLLIVAGFNLAFNIISVVRFLHLGWMERKEIRGINMGSMGAPLDL